MFFRMDWLDLLAVQGLGTWAKKGDGEHVADIPIHEALVLEA